MSQLSREHYTDWVRDIKSRIRQAQIQASKTVSRELNLLYWDIGNSIFEKQEAMGWGKSVVEDLAKDLSQEFHGISGFSPRNLWDMRRFYLEYRDLQELRQLVAEIPWGHNLLLINQVKDLTARQYYLEQTRMCA